MQPDTAMVFAAGFGTRMGDLTSHTPKPLIQAAGKPLIDHALELIPPVINSVVVNLHYLPDQLEAHLSGKPKLKTLREIEILETGGGLKNALPLLGDKPVVTLNSDAVWSGENPIQLLLDHWQPDHMDALTVLVPTQNALEHFGAGDFFLEPHNQIQRPKPGQPAPFVYCGAQIIKTELVARYPKQKFSMNEIWDQLIPAGRMFGCVYSGQWVDVGRPEGLVVAESLFGASQSV